MKEKKKHVNEEVEETCKCKECEETEGLENFSLDEEKEDSECECGCEHHHKHECHKEHCECENHAKVDQYLEMAQRLQADFDNYRKRVAEQLDYQRQEGVKSVIEVFLPCLDTFKEAKKNIADESVLAGINMIEGKILDSLKTLNVEKIASIGEKFNPNLHNVIAVMSDDSKDEDVILEEYQSGWTINGKVIRYSKVVVNKHA